jgi:hypothetical protein
MEESDESERVSHSKMKDSSSVQNSKV